MGDVFKMLNLTKVLDGSRISNFYEEFVSYFICPV